MCGVLTGVIDDLNKHIVDEPTNYFTNIGSDFADREEKNGYFRQALTAAEDFGTKNIVDPFTNELTGIGDDAAKRARQYDIYGPVRTIGSMIPGPWQPFFVAANFANAVADRNGIGALTSAIGGTGGYGAWADRIGNVAGSVGDSLSSLSNWGNTFDSAIDGSSFVDLGGSVDDYLGGFGDTGVDWASTGNNLWDDTFSGAREAAMGGGDAAAADWLATNYPNYDTSQVLDRVGESNWQEAANYLDDTKGFAEGFAPSNQAGTFELNTGGQGSLDNIFSGETSSLSSPTASYLDPNQAASYTSVNPYQDGSSLVPDSSYKMGDFTGGGSNINGSEYIDSGSVIQGDAGIDSLTTNGASQWGAPYEDGGSYISGDKGIDKLTNPVNMRKDMGLKDLFSIGKAGYGIMGDVQRAKAIGGLKDRMSRMEQYQDPFAQQRADTSSRLNQSYNNPESLYKEYMAGQGADFLQRANANYAKAGRRNMMPQLQNQTRQNFYSQYLPQYRQMNDPSKYNVNSNVASALGQMQGGLADMQRRQFSGTGDAIGSLGKLFDDNNWWS